MPTPLNDPNSRPHPPPPPPDQSGTTHVPKGVKKVARDCTQYTRSIPGIDHENVQLQDRRRTLGRGPGNRVPFNPDDPRSHQPYSVGPYPAGPYRPGGGHHPFGVPTPEDAPSRYPAAGRVPSSRISSVPHPSASASGVYNNYAPGAGKNWKRFSKNDRVKVSVPGHGWLIGRVVEVIEGTRTITTTSIRVRYVDLHQQEQMGDFPDHPDFIRHYQDSGY